VRRRTARQGQALVEFALVFPFFIALLLAVFDFGRIVWARGSLEYAAREAARYAIVHGGSELTTCPIGPDELGRADVCPGGSPGTDNGKAVALASAIAAGDNVTATICYGEGCSGDLSVDTNRPGVPVTVTMRSSIALIVGQLFRMFNADVGTLQIDASITMIVNT